MAAARIKSGRQDLSPLGAFANMSRNLLVGLPYDDILVVYKEQNRLADSATYAYGVSDQHLQEYVSSVVYRVFLIYILLCSFQKKKLSITSFKLSIESQNSINYAI